MIKKSTAAVLAALALILTLVSCLKDNASDSKTEVSILTSLTTAVTISETVSETLSVTTAVTERETATQKSETKASTTALTTKRAVPTTSAETEPELLEREYYRSLLTDREKKLYDEWLKKIFNYETIFIDYATADFTYDETCNVTHAMRKDYPEFWLYMAESYDYDDEHCKNGEEVALTGEIYPSYNWYYEDKPFNAVYMDFILEKTDMICDRIILRMPEGTYAEKYEYLARELADMTVYYDDEDGKAEDWSYCYMSGPLLEGKGLCQAYAQAYQYLCNRAGLWCICTGGKGYGVAHSWNVVMLEDGSTYHVDVTWADSEYQGFDESYFLLTEEEIEADHIHEDKEYIVASGKSLK